METIFEWVLAVSLIIGVCVLAIVALYRSGITITDVDFEKNDTSIKVKLTESSNGAGSNTKRPHTHVSIKIENIEFKEVAKKDCERFNFDLADIESHIREEGRVHSYIFAATFSSLPMVFRSSIILVSWDGSSAIVERIVDRSEIYPTSDRWSKALGTYRKATALSYRSKDVNVLLSSSVARRVLGTYQDLIDAISHNHDENGAKDPHLVSLLDEASLALADANIEVGVSRLENILSSAHKILINGIPDSKYQLSLETRGKRTAPIEEPVDLEGGSSSDSLAGIRILVVEDDFSVRDTLESILRALKATVFVCADGKEALRLLISDEFDLIVSDIVMPELDGLELTRIIRASGSNVPILLTTGFPDQVAESIQHLTNRVRVRLLEKPYRRLQLKLIIEEMLSENFGNNDLKIDE